MGDELSQTLATLITANHILHYHGVLDAYGHVSVRSPRDSSTFYMSAELAPALVSSPKEIVEYNVADAQPVKKDAPTGYRERYIHSEIYKRYPAVGSVVHSHAPEVLPYANTTVKTRPAIHMAGFIGDDVPLFDIEEHYKSDSARKDLLVSDSDLGAALASCFSSEQSPSNRATPVHSVVLMRGHGLTVLAPDVKTAVYRSVYTQINASVQTTSQLLPDPGGDTGDQVKYLSLEEQVGSAETNQATQERPWKLWVREVQRSPLYDNVLDQGYR